MSPGSVSVPVSQGQTTLQILLQPSQPGTAGHVENIGPGLSPPHNPTIVQQPRGVISASHTAIRSQLMVSYFTTVNETLVVAASMRKLTVKAKKRILTGSCLC